MKPQSSGWKCSTYLKPPSRVGSKQTSFCWVIRWKIVIHRSTSVKYGKKKERWYPEHKTLPWQTDDTGLDTAKYTLTQELIVLPFLFSRTVPCQLCCSGSILDFQTAIYPLVNEYDKLEISRSSRRNASKRKFPLHATKGLPFQHGIIMILLHLWKCLNILFQCNSETKFLEGKLMVLSSS